MRLAVALCMRRAARGLCPGKTRREWVPERLGLPFRFLWECMSFRNRPLRDRRRSEKERRIAFRLSGGTCRRCPDFSFSESSESEVCVGASLRNVREDRTALFRFSEREDGEGDVRFPRCRRGPCGFGLRSFLRLPVAEDMPVAASRWRRGVYLSSGVRSGERGRRFRCSAVPEASLGRRWGRSGVCPGVFSFRGDGCPFRRAAGSVRRGGEYAFGNGPAVGRGLRRVTRIGSAGRSPTEWGRLAAVADDAGTEKSRPKPGFFRKGICPSARNGKVNR